MTDASTTESFNQRLLRVIADRKSNLCAGFDPDPVRFTDSFCQWSGLQSTDDAQRGSELAQKFLPQVLPHAAVVKPNIAFLEAAAWNESQLKNFTRTIAAGNAISLCDAKRGDIGNTSCQYASTLFDRLGFDAITVNPLMGYDSVAPFLENPAKGCFLLCITSNPGAEDFLIKDELFMRIAEKAMQWNRHNNVGLVVGATQPEYAARVRGLASNLPLLIPGVGAQGGSLEETLDAIRSDVNPNYIINYSRALLYPNESDLPADAAQWWKHQAATFQEQVTRA